MRVAWAALLLAIVVGVAVIVASQILPRPVDTPARPSLSPATTSTAIQTASAVAVPSVAQTVYFAREDLPPLRAKVTGSAPPRDVAEDRIGARLTALWGATNVPPDTFNPFARAGRSGMQGQLGTEIRIDGDLATVTFDLLGGWNASAPDDGRRLFQQLVYTITEEPVIRRALIREKGKSEAVIGTFAVAQPATREAAAGYTFSGAKTTSLTGEGTQVRQEITNVGVAMDTDILTNGPLLQRGSVPGLGRVALEVRATEAVPGGRLDPRFTATLERCDPPTCDGGQWTLAVALPDVTWPSGRAATEQSFDRSPIRSVRVAQFQGGTVAVAIRLDAAFPWRVSTEPLGSNATRLLIDVGGRTSEVGENMAVYVPGALQGVGDRATGCHCGVEGVARVFEANVAWRVRDGNGREVARGNTTASRGTSAVWGTFTALVTIPPNVAGTPTIEIFALSPRDGSEQDVIRIPVTLH